MYTLLIRHSSYTSSSREQQQSSCAAAAGAPPATSYSSLDHDPATRSGGRTGLLRLGAPHLLATMAGSRGAVTRPLRQGLLALSVGGLLLIAAAVGRQRWPAATSPRPAGAADDPPRPDLPDDAPCELYGGLPHRPPGAAAPTFLIAGAQKGGTTYLHSLLRQVGGSECAPAPLPPAWRQLGSGSRHRTPRQATALLPTARPGLAPAQSLWPED